MDKTKNEIETETETDTETETEIETIKKELHVEIIHASQCIGHQTGF